jgi:Uma2 family endonuclease
VPPLAPGDHLTRAEFERRYDAMPPGIKAELIEGIVYMPPPVSHSDHGEPQLDFLTLLGHYKIHTAGISGGDNSSLRLDMENMPQPDGYLLIDASRGGQATITDGYVTGAPELILEVAASSASYDLHEKLRAYRRNGVKEYIVWRTFDKAIDYFIWRDGEYHRFTPDRAGIIRSQIMPGLWLAPAHILSGDMRAALTVLQKGLNSPEHAAFIRKPKRRRTRKG